MKTNSKISPMDALTAAERQAIEAAAQYRAALAVLEKAKRGSDIAAVKLAKAQDDAASGVILGTA